MVEQKKRLSGKENFFLDVEYNGKMERKWTLKDGTVKTKRYEQIGGVDALTYKRKKDAEYRARQTLKETHPQVKTQRKTTKPCSYQLVDEETAQNVKRLRDLGLSYRKLGKAFGLSRHCIEGICYLR